MTMQLGTLRSPTADRGETILRRLRRYLELHRRATLGDLALHFGTTPDAMRGMLDTWLRKGRVRELDWQASCNTSCPTACDDTAMTVYEWIDAERSSAATFTPLALVAPSTGVCRHRD